MAWWSIVGDVFSAIAAPITEWQKRKTVRAQAKMKVTELLAQAEVSRAEAQVRMAERGQIIEADWDARAQQNMRFSFKDEVLLGVFIAPYVLAFIPGMQDHITKYFKIVGDVPLWHLIVVLGIVAASFGLRWLIAPLAKALLKLSGASNGQQRGPTTRSADELIRADARAQSGDDRPPSPHRDEGG